MGRLTRCGVVFAFTLALLVCGQLPELGPLGAATAEAAVVNATITVPDPLAARSVGTFKVLIDLEAPADENNINHVELRVPGSGCGGWQTAVNGHVNASSVYVAKFDNSILCSGALGDGKSVEVQGTLLGGDTFYETATVDIFKPLTLSDIWIGDVVPNMNKFCDLFDDFGAPIADSLCPLGDCPIEIAGRRYCSDDEYAAGEPILMYPDFYIDERTPGKRLKVQLWVEAFGQKQKSTWMPVNSSAYATETVYALDNATSLTLASSPVHGVTPEMRLDNVAGIEAYYDPPGPDVLGWYDVTYTAVSDDVPAVITINSVGGGGTEFIPYKVTYYPGTVISFTAMVPQVMTDVIDAANNATSLTLTEAVNGATAAERLGNVLSIVAKSSSWVPVTYTAVSAADPAVVTITSLGGGGSTIPYKVTYRTTVPQDEDLKVTLRLRKGKYLYDTDTMTVPIHVSATPPAWF